MADIGFYVTCPVREDRKWLAVGQNDKNDPIPGKTVKLAPGGYHLMLLDLKHPLKQGEKVPVMLKFEKAGEVKLSFDVQGIGAQGPTAAPKSGSKMDMKGMAPGMKM